MAIAGKKAKSRHNKEIEELEIYHYQFSVPYGYIYVFYSDIGRRGSRCQYEVEFHVFACHYKSHFYHNSVST
jgi:hypothetical protein